MGIIEVLNGNRKQIREKWGSAKKAIAMENRIAGTEKGGTYTVHHTPFDVLHSSRYGKKLALFESRCFKQKKRQIFEVNPKV